MIHNFADKRALAVFLGQPVRNLPQHIYKRARIKLFAIADAKNINSLREMRGTRLEMLKGDRKGQYSIRVNDQWRICFRWVDGWARDVELVDYH